MEWLKTIREQLGYSQIYVAEATQITQPAYCNIETGNRRPSVKTAKKIATVLNFDWTKFYD